MRLIISVIFILGFMALCVMCQGREGPRNLVLNEQELKFAGSALRTVLGGNANSYRKNRGPRRFSGTFTIIEKEACGGFEVRIDADVDRVGGPGGNRRGYYNMDPENTPGLVTGVVGSGYAGQFNY